MRIPRVRLTIRRLMVAVAMVGLVIAGGIEIRRLGQASRKYRGQAMSHRYSQSVAIRFRDSMASSREQSLSKRRVFELDGQSFVFGPPDAVIASVDKSIEV